MVIGPVMQQADPTRSSKSRIEKLQRRDRREKGLYICRTTHFPEYLHSCYLVDYFPKQVSFPFGGGEKVTEQLAFVKWHRQDQNSDFPSFLKFIYLLRERGGQGQRE